jgi:hypothetical protein
MKNEIEKVNTIVKQLENNIEAEIYENIQNRENQNAKLAGEKGTQERPEN